MKHKDLHLSMIRQPTQSLERAQVERILEQIFALRVGVIGDGCLDIYWHADMTLSELSRETPHHNLPVIRESYSPGAAGNVAVNYRKLNCAEVYMCTVFGEDWRGNLLKEKFRELQIQYMYSSTDGARFTPTYCKTILHGYQGAYQEDQRHDFINRTELTKTVQTEMMRKLDEMAARVDVISVVDQFEFGVIHDQILERLQYWASRGKMIMADSRNRIERFQGMMVKPNEIEALRSYHGTLRSAVQGGEQEWIEAGLHLSGLVGHGCCLTLGDQGAIWIENGQCTFVPTESVEPPVDIVGAGDSFHAGLLSALGVGCPGETAIQFAHLAAAVSIKVLGGVGTASPAEILQRYDELHAK